MLDAVTFILKIDLVGSEALSEALSGEVSDLQEGLEEHSVEVLEQDLREGWAAIVWRGF